MPVDHAGQKRALAPFLERSTPRALLLLTATLLAYLALVAAAVLLPSWEMRMLAALGAGNAIASLFVIGHDAAHGAFTPSRPLNALIGRLAFMPALHNYSLWQVAHNRHHHIDVNVKGLNSWSPLSRDEYAALSPAKRWLQRFYRTPVGLGAYYLVERWWGHKLFPRRAHGFARREACWQDFRLVIVFLTLFCTCLAGLGAWTANIGAANIGAADMGGGSIGDGNIRDGGAAGAAIAIFWGFLVPYAAWNIMMGGTVFLQHTATEVPWFSLECREGPRDRPAGSRRPYRGPLVVRPALPPYHAASRSPCDAEDPAL